MALRPSGCLNRAAGPLGLERCRGPDPKPNSALQAFWCPETAGVEASIHAKRVQQPTARSRAGTGLPPRAGPYGLPPVRSGTGGYLTWELPVRLVTDGVFRPPPSGALDAEDQEPTDRLTQLCGEKRSAPSDSGGAPSARHTGRRQYERPHPTSSDGDSCRPPPKCAAPSKLRGRNNQGRAPPEVHGTQTHVCGSEVYALVTSCGDTAIATPPVRRRDSFCDTRQCLVAYLDSTETGH